MIAVSESLKGRHFTRVADWSGAELEAVLDLADELKELQQRREEHQLLPGRSLGMIFQKPSTRTRVSFEVGIAQLGGFPLEECARLMVDEARRFEPVSLRRVVFAVFGDEARRAFEAALSG